MATKVAHGIEKATGRNASVFEIATGKFAIRWLDGTLERHVTTAQLANEFMLAWSKADAQ